MTNYRRKKPEFSKHFVTSCVWVFTWREPQNTVKSIRSHWPTRRWWGLFCYRKNMGHFCKLFLVLFSPLVNPQFHQWPAGMADRRRWAWASVENNYHLRNHGSFKLFPLFTAAFRAFPYCQMHFSKWHNNFNQNKSTFGGKKEEKSITVLLTCFSWGSVQKCKLIAWYLIMRRGPLSSINHHVL